MRNRERTYPPNCTVCDLNPSRFLAFREKQRTVEAKYGFRLGVPCRTPEQREGHRLYMRDWRRHYREAHKAELEAYRKEWLEKRRSVRREEREARRAELQAKKDASRAAWNERCRIVKEKYGFDLGVVPIDMSPEEAEARKRYEQDRAREYRAAHREQRLANQKAYKERQKLKLERRKRSLANLAKAHEKQRELKRQREAEAKAAKRHAFEEKRRIVLEKYGFTLGVSPVTPAEIEGKKRYEADQRRAYLEANKELIAERKRRRAAQRKRLAIQNMERAAQRKEEERLAKAAKRVEDRERRIAEAAALEESVRQAEVAFSEEREANRAAYLAAKESAKHIATPPDQVSPATSAVAHTSAITIADYLPAHPFRGLLLDETAPTDEELTGDAALPGWSDYARDDDPAAPAAGGGSTPIEPPTGDSVTTGGSEEDDDDERRREQEERIRRIREQYGFTLGKKPETPEEIEGKKRYVADRNRETAIRNREIDLMLHDKERRRKEAAKKRKATIARKKREAAAQAARAAKEAEREARRKAREEARQAAQAAKLEALETERKERAAFKALARELGVPLQKARWTAKHQAIWDKGVRRKAKEKLEAERDERRKQRLARQAAEADGKAERAKALEEKRRIIREKYGFTLGKVINTPEEIEGRKRWLRDKEAEDRKRNHDKITAYNREYRRRKRQEALERAQAKWTPRQWAEWQKRQDAKERGSPAWLVREVAKFLAEDGNLPVNDVMAWIIEHDGIDFLVKGAESMGKDRLQRRSAVIAAACALAFFIDPDNAAMFGARENGNEK